MKSEAIEKHFVVNVYLGVLQLCVHFVILCEFIIYSVSKDNGYSVGCIPVSYTHLDVYKRQVHGRLRYKVENNYNGSFSSLISNLSY